MAEHVEKQSSEKDGAPELEPQTAEYCEATKAEFNFKESLKAKAEKLAKAAAAGKPRAKRLPLDEQIKELSIISGVSTVVNLPARRIVQRTSGKPLDSQSREEVQNLTASLDSLATVDLDLDFEPSDLGCSPTGVGHSDLDHSGHEDGGDTMIESEAAPSTEMGLSPPTIDKAASNSVSLAPLVIAASDRKPSPDLIRRLRSYRKRLSKEDLSSLAPNDEEEDLKRVKELPDDVLKLIKYTADSPWLGSEISVDDDHSLSLYSPGASSLKSAPSSVAPEEPRVVYHPANLPEGKQTAGLNIGADGSAKANARPKVVSIEDTDPVVESDRGRLFLQVNKISNLRGLPVDSSREPKFVLTLDNGQEAVNTTPHSVPVPGTNNNQMSAKIDQEFELIVGKDLQLTITLSVSMKPAHKPSHLEAPITRPPKSHTLPTMPTSTSSASLHSVSSTNTVSKRGVRGILGFGNKRRQAKMQQEADSEMQRSLQQRQQQQQQQQQLEKEESDREQALRLEREKELENFYKRSEIWKGITGHNGEYCRGYILESHYENDVYGTPKSFVLSLYDEWNRKSNGGVPKNVCDLQVTMMFVPKLFAHEKLPVSMRHCLEELRRASTTERVSAEGFLTQQGGDVGLAWRRRWYTLNGSEMVGYQESTGKRRAVIHLENVVEVGEKLSEDLWCIYEDRAFQITFDDGESVAFYADTVDERNQWLRKLSLSAQSCTSQRKSWTDLVLERQS